MKFIQTRKQFVELARRLGVRDDWHEPDEQDEQDVDAVVKGKSFDNAFGAHGGLHPDDGEVFERVVVFKRNGKPVAQVNLATLCAWAAGTDE